MNWQGYYLEAPDGFLLELCERCGRWSFPICLARALVCCPPRITVVDAFRFSVDPTRKDRRSDREELGTLNWEISRGFAVELIPDSAAKWR